MSGSFGFDDHVAAIVPLHSKGVDHGWVEKRASAPLFDFQKIAGIAKPFESLVHLLALGDGETIGANRNGDYFPKAANVRYHPTFLKAHYFHNHINKDPAKSFGRVVAAAHNGPMGRVELVVGIDTRKAAADLDELEKKGEFPVSMSCRVPYDECMICGHRAKSRKEYCKHASQMMGQYMQNGKQACVRNDHPDFFDISKVYRGADRVAWTFRKLEKAASSDEVVGGAALAEILGMSDVAVPVIRSARTIHKSSVASNLCKSASDEFTGICNALHDDSISDEQIAILKSSSDLGPVFSALHRAGVCLPLRSFIRLVDLDKSAAVSEEAIRASVARTLRNLDTDTALASRVCSNGSYDGTTQKPSEKVASAVHSLRPQHGLFYEDAYDRIVGSAVRKGLKRPVFAKSAGNADPHADLIAEEYVSYLVSFADTSASHEIGHGEFVQNLTALRALV